jgi:hypothetical protein
MKPFVVFDLDGTLALTHHRDHFIRGRRKDWRSFFAACVNDQPNEPVMEIFRALKLQDFRLEIWSGRSDEVYSETLIWLAKHDIAPDKLRMRKRGDFTPDQILKESWLKESDEKPLAIFDDRDKVVAMWRRHGITCLQVAEGNF